MMSHKNRITVPLLIIYLLRDRDPAIACCDISPHTPAEAFAAPSTAVEKGANRGLVRLPVVTGDVGAGHPRRVAEEVVLIQRLAAGEGGDAGVPHRVWVRPPVIPGGGGAAHPRRVAEELVLIQRLAAGEGGDAGAPHQPE